MGKTISFFGADHKCGTSMVAQCAAEILSASLPELNIILIHAEGAIGNDYTKAVCESLDSIRPYLEERLLDAHSLVKKSREKSNLYYISGTSKLESAFNFHPDMGEYYVKKLAEEFDLVICDCGSEIEHGLSLGSIFSSDYLYLVASQSESAIKRYEFQKVLFDKLRIDIRRLILNKYDRKLPNTVSFVAERLLMENEEILPLRFSPYGMMAEFESESLISCGDEGYRKDIEILCRDIISGCGFEGI